MQFACNGWGTSGASNETVRQLSNMLHEEPVVRHAVRLVQHSCLSGGIRLRFGSGNVPPTPQFAEHVNHYYFYFCRDAIEAMLSVGFVPYRIRRLGNGARIPEVLPLGTYSWYVARHPFRMRCTPWYMTTIDGRLPDPNKRKRQANEEHGDEDGGDEPLLRYEVSCPQINVPVAVYEFERPDPFFVCNSQLSSLLVGYACLRKKRECMLRADMFNSQPSVVFEAQDKARINDVAKSGATVLGVGNETYDGQEGDKRNMGTKQETQYELLEEFRERSRLPHESVAIMAPTNHSVHGLDRVLSPAELSREEMNFARNVALTIGLPEGLVMHGYSVPSGGGASGSRGVTSASARSGSGGGGGRWHETPESNNRQMLNLCRNINVHLEILLAKVYTEIYGGGEPPSAATTATQQKTDTPASDNVYHGEHDAPHHSPREVSASPPKTRQQQQAHFQIAVIPTFNMDQLMAAFNSRMLDDDALSAMLECTWGAPLGSQARQARDELRKAEFVLPFRDKKEPAKKKPK